MGASHPRLTHLVQTALYTLDDVSSKVISGRIMAKERGMGASFAVCALFMFGNSHTSISIGAKFVKRTKARILRLHVHVCIWYCNGSVTEVHEPVVLISFSKIV